MKVFISWADKDRSPELGAMVRRLGEHGHAVVYWLAQPEARADVPAGTVFHDYVDALHVRPAPGVDTSSFLPPDQELVGQLYKIESLALTMMNRSHDELGVDARRRLYYDMVRYWNGVLETYRPDYIIFPNTPHFDYDFIIYELARLKKISCLCFDDTRLAGRLLYLYDYWQGSERLHSEQQRLDGQHFTVSDLAADIRAYYEPRAGTKFTSAPKYIQDQKRKYSWWQRLKTDRDVWQSIRNGSFVWKGPRYVYEQLKIKGARTVSAPLLAATASWRRTLKTEYERLAQEPDWSVPFIYLPLQVQPERTTSPQGDMFVDQILLVQTVAAGLPFGWKIYIKEHPIQWLRFGYEYSSSRYRGYYERLAKIPGVVLVPITTSSYQLIDASQCVSAVTGSAGWEAVLRNKPAIIFGSVWYDTAPGIFKANGAAAFKDQLAKIQNGYNVQPQEIINYLKAFELASIRGFISPTAGKESGMSKGESMKNIGDFILQELKKYAA